MVLQTQAVTTTAQNRCDDQVQSLCGTAFSETSATPMMQHARLIHNVAVGDVHARNHYLPKTIEADIAQSLASNCICEVSAGVR